MRGYVILLLVMAVAAESTGGKALLSIRLLFGESTKTIGWIGSWDWFDYGASRNL